MLLLIPLLPFIGFLINAAYGRRLSKSVSGGLACLSIVAAFAGATERATTTGRISSSFHANAFNRASRPGFGPAAIG